MADAVAMKAAPAITGRGAMRRFKCVLLAVFLLGICRVAAAYQQAGHLFTVNLVVRKVAPAIPLKEEDIRVITFCTQLPDQSSDLDAITVYNPFRTNSMLGWVEWLFNDDMGSDGTRRMITIQQLVHGLTGGKAKALQEVAGDDLKQLAAQAFVPGGQDHIAKLCALGFAFHLYGDSFAHQMMDGNGNDPTLMYPTGRGHVADNVYPDLPLCSRLLPGRHPIAHCDTTMDGRFGAWANYWAQAAGAIVPGGSVPAKIHDQIVAEIFALKDPSPDPNGNTACKGAATDLNNWKETCIEQHLAADDSGANTIDKFFAGRDELPCRDVMAAAQAQDIVPLVSTAAGRPVDVCELAWDYYYAVAKSAFLARPDARGAAFSFKEEVYLPDPLLPAK